MRSRMSGLNTFPWSAITYECITLIVNSPPTTPNHGLHMSASLCALGVSELCEVYKVCYSIQRWQSILA